ncbi:Interferon tau [Myotis brandtii]|uniref:Interferon tau n=1 Tax=Myotis brandtii TaxID=109478 RepID=S7NRA2_MYOBR|nr:PREDICTED: interferon alpha-8-like [Myotis brandtii]EPQ20229.1 Interferon tau [Myotis brandtii]
MAQISLWLLAGVMLCSIPAGSLEDNIHWVHTGDKGRVLILLSQLEKTPPYFCLADRNDFKFPWKLQTMMQMNKTQRICLHHVMTAQIFKIFATRRSFAEWDRNRLSKVLSSLHQSLEDLEDQAQKEKNNLACPNLGVLARKYFRKIPKYLKEKKYSSCAWEVVLVEMMARVGNMLLSLKKSQQIQNKFIW